MLKVFGSQKALGSWFLCICAVSSSLVLLSVYVLLCRKIKLLSE